MPKFPSVDWFETLREEVNQDPRFRALGSCDAVVGVKVGARVFSLTFEAFECSGVAEIDVPGLRDVDFYLEMSPKEWREVIQNIRANGKADPKHTLNSLDLTRPGGILRSKDALLRLSFYRYYLSLQFFFDAAAKVETAFA